MVHSAVVTPEVKSCTSAASWRESKEACTTRLTQSPLHSCTTHTLPCDWMAGDGRRANWIALAPKGRQENILGIGSVCKLSYFIYLTNPPVPLTSYTWLEVEEATFAVTTIPSCHMTEALTASCLRVAFVYMAEGSSRIAGARYREQMHHFKFHNNKLLHCYQLKSRKCIMLAWRTCYWFEPQVLEERIEGNYGHYQGDSWISFWQSSV